MWKPFPGEAPVKKFTKKHFYVLGATLQEGFGGYKYTQGKIPEVCYLVQFKGIAFRDRIFLRSTNAYVKIPVKHYTFTNLATTVHGHGNGELARDLDTLKDHYLIKEITLEEFPLYISWGTTPAFHEILKHGQRKTRKRSKSSIVISRRQTYEKSKLERKSK